MLPRLARHLKGWFCTCGKDNNRRLINTVDIGTNLAGREDMHPLDFEVCVKTAYFVSKYFGLKLSVVIVNYNVKYFLEQCLFSVLKASSEIDAEIVVIDNHSSDGSRSYLENKFPDVHFKWNASNDGFAKANNAALSSLQGDLILFLNPDTIVPEDCFQKCIHFFLTHPQCGALGVRMLDGSGKFLPESKRGFPSPAASFYKLTGLISLFPQSPVFARYYAGHLHEMETNEVEVLAGAFMMVSKKALEEVKGFDERFFMYAEDIDLSYRILQAGFKVYYYPGTSILHFKGESTQKSSPLYARHFFGAMELFVQKHYKEQKAYYFLMRMAIKANKGFYLLKRALSSRKQISQTNSSPSTTLVIASEHYFNVLLHLIKFAPTPLPLVGNYDLPVSEPLVSVAEANKLTALMQKKQIGQLVLTTETLRFKQIIELMNVLKGDTDFLIHAMHSHSIVGSSYKHSNGICIAAP